MEKRKMNTRYMATLAMLCGVLLVMGVYRNRISFPCR